MLYKNYAAILKVDWQLLIEHFVSKLFFSKSFNNLLSTAFDVFATSNLHLFILIFAKLYPPKYMIGTVILQNKLKFYSKDL